MHLVSRGSALLGGGVLRELGEDVVGEVYLVGPIVWWSA